MERELLYKAETSSWQSLIHQRGRGLVNSCASINKMCRFRHRELAQVFQETSGSFLKKQRAVQDLVDERSGVRSEKIHQSVGYVCKEVLRKLNDCNRTYDRFLEKYAVWLDEFVSIKIREDNSSDTAIDLEASVQDRRGRPSASFEDGVARTQLRKTKDLRQ